jgi:hypothetical protein
MGIADTVQRAAMWKTLRNIDKEQVGRVHYAHTDRHDIPSNF